MVSIEEEREIDKFIRPIRSLYSDYATTIDKFKEEHGVLLNNYELEDLGADPEYKLYAKFSKDKGGELASELVQTWICDNHLQVTNCIHIALDNRKQAFCNWFRGSEQFTSPDELLLYCLGKQNNLHVSIFNSKYVWSTLANHIWYDYFEILEHSHILLVFWENAITLFFARKRNLLKTPWLRAILHHVEGVKAVVMDVLEIWTREPRRKQYVDLQIKNPRVSVHWEKVCKH